MEKIRPYLLAFFATILFLPSAANAQVYRPSQRWSQLSTPHFKIVYKSGEDSLARASARILESQYALTSKLTGGAVKNHPVVLNSYNDLSNGYVTTAHFRTEIEVPPIKGKIMNPRSGGWLETVLPHELVHAQQFDVTPAVGLSWLVRFFSPDYARSLNGAAHSGFAEGLAVYHESQLRNDGGRGNWSTFTNQFDTYWRSEGQSRRWRVGQGISPAGSQWPRDRHYVAGYPFARYLQETYGSNTVRNIIDFHSRWPIFGYGVAVWHQTGDSPAKLNRKFDSWYGNLLESEGRQANNVTFQNLPLNRKGAQVRRPVWMSDNKLFFYAYFYNEPSGLWSYDLISNKYDRLKKTSITEDYVYEIDNKRHELIFSQYQAHPIHTERYLSTLVRLDLRSGKAQAIPNTQRHYSPTVKGNTIHALVTDLDTPVWTYFDGKEWRQILQLKPNSVVQVSANPVNETVAVIANINGLQALWLTDLNKAEEVKDRLPDLGFSSGSIIDMAWSPDGKKLLLTIDLDGTTGLYEYQLEKKSLEKLELGVNVALEGSYSPDGSKIAFVYQIGDEMLPAVVNISQVQRLIISSDRFQIPEDLLERERLASHLVDSSYSWPISTYRGGLTWFWPRTFTPFYEAKNGSVDPRFGLSILSSELLQRQSYEVDFSVSNGRIWHSLRYMNTMFYPGIILKSSNEPLNGRISTNQGGSLPAVLQDKQLSLTLPFRLVLHQNVSSSVLYFHPEIQFRSLRALDQSGRELADYFDIRTLRGFTSIYLGVERAYRDVQYRKGAVLFADGRHDLETYLNEKGRAIRLGIDTYWPILAKHNQSLKVRLQMLSQAGGYFYDIDNLTRNQFSEDIYLNERNLANLQLRYAIPFIYPDTGGLLVPLYIDRSYFVLFSNTVAPFRGNENFHPIKNSRTSFGLEWRFVTGFPNFRFDIGIGVGYELTRNRYAIFFE